MAQITGNTYPVKERLRALGGKWDSTTKAWVVPDERAEEARALVAAAPKDSGKRPAYRPTRCKECGARPGPRGWPKIYRNGICSDCYRDRADGYDD